MFSIEIYFRKSKVYNWLPEGKTSWIQQVSNTLSKTFIDLVQSRKLFFAHSWTQTHSEKIYIYKNKMANLIPPINW